MCITYFLFSLTLSKMDLPIDDPPPAYHQSDKHEDNPIQEDHYIDYYEKYANTSEKNELNKIKYKTILYACKNGNLDIIKCLIENHGFKIDNYDETLQLASENGHLDIITYLNGISINNRNIEILYTACRMGHLKIIKSLVECPNDSIRIVNIHSDDNKALHLASEYDHLDIVSYLIEHGASVSADDDKALQVASKRGNIKIVKYLIDHGAGHRIDNEYVLRYARESGFLTFLNNLINDDTKDTKDKVKQYFAYIDDINKNYMCNGNLEEYKYILRNNALRINNEFEKAIQGGYINIVKYLVEHCNADPHINNEQALMISSKIGYIKIVKYLVEHCNADVHANKCNTILSSYNGSLEVVEYLSQYCKNCKNTDAVGNNINTMDLLIINTAQGGNKIEIFKYIFEYSDKSPASLKKYLLQSVMIHPTVASIIEYGKSAIIEFLVKSGADIHYGEFNGPGYGYSRNIRSHPSNRVSSEIKRYMGSFKN